VFGILLRKLRKKYGHVIGLSRTMPSPRHLPINLPPTPDDVSVPDHTREVGLAVAAIIRDEGPYLNEWVAFHHMLGVERFVLYDNGSVDSPVDHLRRWIEAGIVEFIPWPHFLKATNAQHMSYAHACKHLEGRAEWVAFLDLDEYLFPPGGGTLTDAMAKFGDESAVAVFLRCFGPGGNETRPEGLVTSNYRQCLEDTHWENRQYKSIVRPERVVAVVGAQRFELRGQRHSAVDENGKALYHSTKHDHTSTHLRINHYATRSLEEFEAKLKRRYFWSSKRDEQRREEKRKQHEHLFHCAVRDEAILRFVPELERHLEAWNG